MPTISTIKPGGGGDYTTLQAWEDWADGEASADQWAECYSGDLGALNISGWTATPSASLYPRVYGVSGSRPNGVYGAGGAYINNGSAQAIVTSVAYTEIDGLDLTGLLYTVELSAANCVLRNCVLKSGFAGFTTGVMVQNGGSATVYNNIIKEYGDGVICRSNTASAVTAYLYNNTIYNNTNGVTATQTSGALALTTKNNISMGNSGSDYRIGSGSPTWTSDNNIAEDASLTSAGVAGSNDLESQTLASVLTDAANDDFTLASSSPAIDAGADLSGTVDTDIAGLSRPQNSVYDIGAFEDEYSGPVTYTWDGASANWSTTSNWSGSTEPDSTSDVTFDDTSTQDCTIDGASDCNTLTITSGYTGTITCTNGLTIQGAISLSGVTTEAIGGAITLSDGIKITANGYVGGGTITISST